MSAPVPALTHLDALLARLGGCLGHQQQTSPCTALVEITDAPVFIAKFDQVEREIGFRIECTAHSGGYCELRITTEAA